MPTLRRQHPNGSAIVADWFPGDAAHPVVFFLPGLRSDRRGTKALAIGRWATSHELGFASLDYRGHGESDGRFEDTTLFDWLADAELLLDALGDRPVIAIGSSMGGWLAACLAGRRPLRAVLTIAAAPDFTEHLSPELAAVPDGGYGLGPIPISPALRASGRALAVLPEGVQSSAPLLALHGRADTDVPWTLSEALVAAWRGAPARLHIIEDGDHRLSRPRDLTLILSELAIIADRSNP